MSEVTSRATEIAKAILRDKKQASLPTKLELLAAGEFLEIEPFNSPGQVEGRFELCLSTPTIYVNLHDRTFGDERVRFTLAHELGHFFLHRKLLRAGRSFHDDTFQFIAEERVVEQEANEFAGECLLPSELVLNEIRGRVLDLGLTSGLATKAKASLQATAIKLSKLSSSRLCFFWEESGVVKWAAPSDDWRANYLPWSAWRRKPLPSGSHASKEAGDFREREVSFSVWSPNSRDRDEPLFESAVRRWYGRLILVVDSNADTLIEG